jgi:hypothetical protein
MGAGIIIAKSRLNGFHNATQDLSNNLAKRPLLARQVISLRYGIWSLLFSNRPVGVKHFQTTHYCSVDVTRGLVLLFGIGA